MASIVHVLIGYYRVTLVYMILCARTLYASGAACEIKYITQNKNNTYDKGNARIRIKRKRVRVMAKLCQS